MQKRTRRPHGIKTQKISISVSAEDLKVLQREAKRTHAGNVSRVIHELLAALRRREAAERVSKKLGGDKVTEAEKQSIRDEIAAALSPQTRRRAA